MKITRHFRISAVGLCFALAAGCTSTYNLPITLPGTVGPLPAARLKLPLTGSLIVFTELVTNGVEEDARREEFRVFSEEGILLRTINRQVDLGVPDAMQLEPGDYLIRSRVGSVGIVTVSVRIGPGRVTLVHLDGAYAMNPNTSRDSLVMLPNGRVVGYRADAENR